MLMQIGQKPESDFSEPIGMLEDCHKRIIYFLKSLVNVAETTTSSPLDGSQREALQKALRYFREAAPRHTADEEESLFPRLRQLEIPEFHAVMTQLDNLEADHLKADIQHTDVEAIGSLWLLQGTLEENDRKRLRTLLGDLVHHYQRHIALEENEIFSVAKKVLSSSDKNCLGTEMARRRGIAK